MKRVGITGGIGSGKSTVCEMFAHLGIPVYNTDIRARELMGGIGNDDVRKGDGFGSGGGENSARGGIRRAIIELLGEEAYRGDIPDRAFIASKVFGDKMLLASLNAIIHPAVAEDFEAWAMAFGTFKAREANETYGGKQEIEARNTENVAGAANSKGKVTDAKGGSGNSEDEVSPPAYIIMESAILFESGFDRFVDKTVAVRAPENMRIERIAGRGGISREQVIQRMANQMGEDERNSRADYKIDNSGDLSELAACVKELDKLLKQ